MAESNVISLMTGAVPGFDDVTSCHSGNLCLAVSPAPGREGWALVQIPDPEGHRSGWWCPHCVSRLRNEMSRLGFAMSSRDVPITSPGTA
jgi:hypothetical protein